jgi:tRNA/tmRNA/rRNA uracil-C5-methylase (TrmA/RlmC/RlmD family)
VKLAVRGSVVRPQVGLFERHSHRLLPVPHCRVHHPRLNDAVAALLQVHPPGAIPTRSIAQSTTAAYMRA